MEQFVSVATAARELGVKEAYVRQLVKVGAIPKRPYNRKSYDVDLQALVQYRNCKRKYVKRG